MRNEEWTKNAVRKRVLIKDAPGPGLLYENGSLYVHDGEGHVMYLGVSGSGKTRRGTVTLTMQIIKNKQSAVIVDPKGEIYAKTKDMVPYGYVVHVIDFRKLYEDHAEGWNPLRSPHDLWISGTLKNKTIAEQMIENLAVALYPRAKNTDPFWINSARSLFIAAVYSLFACAKPEQINLANVFYLVSKGDERYGATTYLREFYKMHESDENISMGLESYVTTADETKAGIRSVFLEGLSLAVKSESLREFMSRDDLNINELKGDKPTLIYIIIPDETPIYDDLGGVLVSQLMTHFVRIAEQDYDGRLPIKLHCLIEELGNVGRAIPNLPHLLTAGRSRNIRVELVLQSLSQLDDIYGKSNATTISSNCDVRIAFRVNDIDTLDELSLFCGEREVDHNGSITKERLITASQLGAMETGQALVIISGRVKFITWLPDYQELPVSRIRPTKKAVVNKGKKSRTSTFDVKAYVREKKAQAMNNAGSSDKKSDSLFNIPSLFGSSKKPDDTDVKNDETAEIDRLIADIDKQIKAIEEQEKAEKEKAAKARAKKERAKNTNNSRKTVVKVSCGEDKRMHIARIISEMTKTDLYAVWKAMRIDKQAGFELPSVREARDLVRAVTDAGGTAWIDVIH